MSIQDFPLEETRGTKTKRIARVVVREVIETIVLFAIVMGIFRFTIGNYVIEQTSAKPNYNPGDRILVDQQLYKWTGGLKRGDLIVLEGQQGRTERLFKRVIGLPGEKVEVRENHVFINGQQLLETYVDPTNNFANRSSSKSLGPEEYWVMGDNRAGSSDSTSWNTGILSKDVVGRAWIRYYPFDKLQLIHGVTYSP